MKFFFLFQNNPFWNNFYVQSNQCNLYKYLQIKGRGSDYRIALLFYTNEVCGRKNKIPMMQKQNLFLVTRLKSIT